jgi:hypothetical protein
MLCSRPAAGLAAVFNVMRGFAMVQELAEKPNYAIKATAMAFWL